MGGVVQIFLGNHRGFSWIGSPPTSWPLWLAMELLGCLWVCHNIQPTLCFYKQSLIETQSRSHSFMHFLWFILHHDTRILTKESAECAKPTIFTLWSLCRKKMPIPDFRDHSVPKMYFFHRVLSSLLFILILQTYLGSFSFCLKSNF